MSETEIIKPYSYHTFMFPFLWDNSGKIKRKTFKKCLHVGWKDDKFDSANNTTEFYNQYHYFNRAMHNAMYYKEDNDIVWNYKFDIAHFNKNEKSWLEGSKNNTNAAKYVIKKDDKKIELCINSIRLKLFNTGVGILIWELENYQENDEKSINFINDYGRRVYPPYLDGKGKGGGCADSIALKYGDQVLSLGCLVCDNKPNITSGCKTEIIDPIVYLLTNDKTGRTVVLDKSCKSRKKFFIEPIIDDRMFVACFYKNEQFADDMIKWDEKEESYQFNLDAYKWIPYQNNNTARRLYELMFVDGDRITCNSRTMLRDLLEKHIYNRWGENWYIDNDVPKNQSGSFTGITEYSMITVSAYDGDELTTPFLAEYIEMMILVLAQRASLLAFERLVSDCSCNKADIKKVQRKYVLFKSQLLLREVTPQQQGIELYDMLLENLFIEQRQNAIENQIESLLSLKNLSTENKENFLLMILAALGVSEVVDYTFVWLGYSEEFLIERLIVSGVLIVLSVLLFLLISKRKKL